MRHQMRLSQDSRNRPEWSILEAIIRQFRISPLLLRGGGAARETLLYFAVARTFCEAARTIARYHVAPECHRSRMAHIFDDFPVAGESVENQGRGVAADTRSPVLHPNKELRHSKIRSLLARHGDARPGDQGKAYGIGSLENEQRMRLVVGEPVGEYLILVRVVRAENGKQAGIEIGQGLYVLAVDALDPAAIQLRMFDVADTDEQRVFILVLKKTQPGRTRLMAVRPGLWNQKRSGLWLCTRPP